VSIIHTGERDAEVQLTGAIANLARGLEGPKKHNAGAIEYVVVILAVLALQTGVFLTIMNDSDIDHWNSTLRTLWAIFAFPTFAAGFMALLFVVIWAADRPSPDWVKRWRQRRSVF
jgi:hypothetical protein